MTLETGWGIRPDTPDAIAAWGARAIYTENRLAYEDRFTKRGTRRKRGVVDAFNIDLVWDRKGVAGDEVAIKRLCAWLDKTALPWLRRECTEKYLTPDCGETVKLVDGAFTLVASPRESYGYLYIGAWEIPTSGTKEVE